MSEKALVFTKPMYNGFDPLAFREGELADKIMQGAEESGLTKVELALILLTPEVLMNIYSHLNGHLLGATLSHLGNMRSVLFVFEGDQACSRIAKVIGTETDPSTCAPGSIRRIWWEKTRNKHVNPNIGEKGIEVTKDRFYWFNFVHCSRTPAEFKSQYPILAAAKQVMA